MTMDSEVLESVDTIDRLIIPQGPTQGLYTMNDSLHYNNNVYPILLDKGPTDKISSVKLDNEKLIISLGAFPSIVQPLHYIMEVIDPAINSCKEIEIQSIKQPELSIR